MQPETSESQVQESLQDREQNLQRTEQDNIRRLREKSEQKEREYQHKLNAMQQELDQAKRAAQVNINDDDMAEGRHIKAIADEVKSLREEQRKEREAQEARLSELRIKAEIPHIEQVVNEKNLAILKERYPHLHNSIFNGGDMYERAKIAHTLITEMRIAESGQNEDRVNTNTRKPQSGQSGALQNKYLYDQNNPSQEELRSTYELAQQYARGKN